MDNFWSVIKELWEQSYLIRGLIALTLTGIVSYLFVAQGYIPQPLFDVWLLVLGYFFGIAQEKNKQKKDAS